MISKSITEVNAILFHFPGEINLKEIIIKGTVQRIAAVAKSNRIEKTNADNQSVIPISENLFQL